MADYSWWKPFQYAEYDPNIYQWQLANWMMPYLNQMEAANLAQTMYQKNVEAPGTLPGQASDWSGYGNAQTGSAPSVQSWMNNAQQFANAGTQGLGTPQESAFTNLQQIMAGNGFGDNMSRQDQINFSTNFQNWWESQEDKNVQALGKSLAMPTLQKADPGMASRDGRVIMGGGYEYPSWTGNSRVLNQWFVS